MKISVFFNVHMLPAQEHFLEKYRIPFRTDTDTFYTDTYPERHTDTCDTEETDRDTED